MLQQVIIFRINMHIHIHFSPQPAPSLPTPQPPIPLHHKMCLIFSRSLQQLHSVEPPQCKVSGFQAQLDEKKTPFCCFKRDSIYPGRWCQCVWSLAKQVWGLLASMQASCHRRGPLIALMTRVRGHCGRSDRCGDRGTPSAVPGDTSKSGKASPEAERERWLCLKEGLGGEWALTRHPRVV